MAVTVDSYYPLTTSSPVQPAQSDFLRWHAGLWSDGIYAGTLNAGVVSQRGAGANMSVDVATCRGIIRGAFFEVGAIKNLPIGANSSGSTRIDLVVGRLVASTPIIQLDVVAGTPGSGVAPALTQTVDASNVPLVWEIPFAEVTVANGAATIVDANIAQRQQYFSGKGETYSGTRASAATLVPPYGMNVLVDVSGTTTITNITARPAGTILTLRFTSANCQVTAGGNILIGRTFISGIANQSLLMLWSNGTNWYEIGRSGEQVAAHSFYGNNTDAAAAAALATLVPGDLPQVLEATAYLSADPSIPNNTTTYMNWASEAADTGGMHYTSAANLTGTVSKTNGSPTLTGAGTLFQTELSVGQVISVPGVATEYKVVSAIASNTSLTVASNFANTAAGQTATRMNSPMVAMRAGKHLVIAQVDWYGNTVGIREAWTEKNRVTTGPFYGYTKYDPGATAGMFHRAVYIIALNQYDFIEVAVKQNSGGALSIYAGSPSPDFAYFSMIYLGKS